jgi:RNA polymerase sigma factor (TIGR02999 family)
VSRPPETVTALLQRWSAGDEAALDRLLPLVYGELRRLAASFLARERPGHTLQPTAVVHEAYLRLVDQQGVRVEDRGHFLAIAARLMRQILVDHARARDAAKRGGKTRKLTLDDGVISFERDPELIALDDALSSLAELDVRQSRIVEMRFFGGLSIEETAEAVGISPATVKREWDSAKAWLRREISGPA